MELQEIEFWIGIAVWGGVRADFGSWLLFRGLSHHSRRDHFFGPLSLLGAGCAESTEFQLRHRPGAGRGYDLRQYCAVATRSSARKPLWSGARGSCPKPATGL